MTPYKFRQKVRQGTVRGQTAGQCDGFIQANLAILPAQYADSFEKFCRLNEQACPLLAVGEVGSWSLPTLGMDIDVRTDVPAYVVYRDGERSEQLDAISDLWREDFVVFAIGCSYSFEYLLLRENLPVRHLENGCAVPAYVTNIRNKQAGPFGGNLVVSMRPFKPADAIRAIEVTSNYPNVHGAPVHMGNPKDIGIRDLSSPEICGNADVREGEIPLFWACGVTPQVAIMDAKIPLAIGHAPGHMLVTDIPLDSFLARAQ